MKYGKIMILGAILASCVPAALATVLTGDISTSGTGRITAPSIAFGAIVNSNPGGGYFDQSTGAVITGNGGFHMFDSAAIVHYVPGATSTVTNHAGAYTLRSPAKLTFSTPTPAAPVLFEIISEHGVTLDLYLTSVQTPVTLGQNRVINSHGVVTNPGVQGAFVAQGYVTLSTTGAVQTPGIFFLTNSSPGTGTQAFSADFISTATPPVPEPASIALLGTGMLGAAGLMFRKRREA